MKRKNTPERISAAYKLCSSVCLELLSSINWMDRPLLAFAHAVAMKAPYRQVDQTLFGCCVEFAKDERGVLDPKMKAAFAEFVAVYKKADCKD